MARRSASGRWVVAGLIGTLAGNAAFDAVGIYGLAGSTAWGTWVTAWVEADLDRLEFPRDCRSVFPVLKTASAAGLLVGRRWPAMGRLTAAALVVYFVLALGFHARAKDPAVRYGPAIGMLAWSCAAFRAFGGR